MPSITFLTPAETELKEPGYGGRPPFDDSPEDRGGGGDDDSHDHWRGPRKLLHQTRFFLFSLLSVDLIFFAVLVMYDYARQNNLAKAVSLEQPLLVPPILFLNSALLLLSVATMEIARRNIFREIDVLEEWLGLGRPALKRTLPWLGASFALGSLFLVGQWAAWRQLTAEGFSLSSRSAAPAGSCFYLLTGVHAIHLAAGLGALLFCLLALGKLKRVELRQIAVDLSAWSWFSFSGVWMVLLFVLASS